MQCNLFGGSMGWTNLELPPFPGYILYYEMHIFANYFFYLGINSLIYILYPWDNYRYLESTIRYEAEEDMYNIFLHPIPT